MMNRLFHILAIILMTSSCIREDVPFADGEIVPETVNVSLSLRIADAEDGTIGTKAIDDPADVTETEIVNLCIMQFEGTDDCSRLVGNVHYIQGTEGIKLADSYGEVNTLVIIANNFGQLPKPKTLGEMKTSYHSLESISDLFGHEGEDGDETKYYQRLSGIVTCEIKEGTQITASLKRSMAKINISIDNDGTDNLRIESIQLCNLSSKDYYLAGSLSETKDIYKGLDRFDDRVVQWNGDPSGIGNSTYSFYVPANLGGVDESISSAQQKNKSELTSGSTCVKIIGYYGEYQDIPIIYTFYLGRNLVNDFNIHPNTIYNYRFTFEGKGDCTLDSRIEDIVPISFGTDSNCYILNPPDVGTRSYTFNVVHRPNIFWGERYGLSSQYPNFQINNEKNWYATILWSDIQMSREQADAFLVRKVGTGSGSYDSDSQRVKVTVPSDMSHGNVIIGIYIDTPETILWSWHLWITDYDPEFINGHAPEEEKYIYPVTGGEVHRYAGSGWKTDGMYENGYVMDRNLGALSQNYSTKGCGFFYQFGRKDPFPGNYPIWTYYENSVPTEHTTLNMMPADDISTGKKDNFAYAVTKPRTFITASSPAANWTNDNIFNNGGTAKNTQWMDPYPDKRGDHEETGGHRNKSFFDPCPIGWRLPGTSAWADDFIADSNGSNTTDPQVTIIINADPKGRGKGLTYYPNGYIADRDKTDAPTIFFPESNYRKHTGALGGTGYYYILKSTYPAHNSYCYAFGSSKGSFANGTISFTAASAVRCLKEHY